MSPQLLKEFIMNVHDIVKKIINNPTPLSAKKTATAFAPANIALCKYWGKRNVELNLPITSSLSISLGNKGATTTIQLHQKNNDQFFQGVIQRPFYSAMFINSTYGVNLVG